MPMIKLILGPLKYIAHGLFVFNSFIVMLLLFLLLNCTPSHIKIFIQEVCFVVCCLKCLFGLFFNVIMFETNKAQIQLPCPQRAESSYENVNCRTDRVDDVGWSPRVVVAVSSVTY